MTEIYNRVEIKNKQLHLNIMIHIIVGVTLFFFCLFVIKINVIISWRIKLTLVIWYVLHWPLRRACERPKSSTSAVNRKKKFYQYNQTVIDISQVCKQQHTHLLSGHLTISRINLNTEVHRGLSYWNNSEMFLLSWPHFKRIVCHVHVQKNMYGRPWESQTWQHSMQQHVKR